MNSERSPFQTEYSTYFLLNKNSQSFIPYAYSPLLTDDKLSSYNVNALLQKIEAKYSSRSDMLKASLGIYLGLGGVFCLNAYFNPQSSYSNMRVLFQKVFLPMSILTGSFVFWRLRENQKKIQAIIDKENEAIIERGLRWHLPKNSQTIELCTDYKFFANKQAINDEENIQNPYKRPQSFLNNPAINENEDSHEKTSNQFAIFGAMGLYGIANLANFMAQFSKGKARGF